MQYARTAALAAPGNLGIIRCCGGSRRCNDYQRRGGVAQIDYAMAVLKQNRTLVASARMRPLFRLRDKIDSFGHNRGRAAPAHGFIGRRLVFLGGRATFHRRMEGYTMNLPATNWYNKAGTSTRPACRCGSWLDHWRTHSGGTLPALCSVNACNNIATVGAHVAHSTVDGERIVPMCASCNAGHGAFSLKAGTSTAIANRAQTCGQ